MSITISKTQDDRCAFGIEGVVMNMWEHKKGRGNSKSRLISNGPALATIVFDDKPVDASNENDPGIKYVQFHFKPDVDDWSQNPGSIEVEIDATTFKKIYDSVKAHLDLTGPVDD